MRCTHHDRDREERVEVRLDGEVIKSMDGFKYLGSTITVDGSEEREVTRRIQAGWKNWREVSGVLCDRRMPVERESLQESSTTSHDVWHGGYTNHESE